LDEQQRIVRVALAERAYEICIGTAILEQTAARLLAGGEAVTHAVLISDEAVAAHTQRVAAGFRAEAIRIDTIAVASGERSKSVQEAARLWDWLLEIGADRKSVIVAIGGGVVGDLAGFVAATFARGLRFCQVPTTLLAQVDSSVGGKTGINLAGAKNMVGCFWQPDAVLIDTEVLGSLPDREYLSGMAEVVKYGVIMDADLFADLESQAGSLRNRDSATLRDVVARCCRRKADVVEADEREVTGQRAILNYGHTFAHAFEAVAGYGELLHGEAVSIGMICASRLAEKLHRVGADLTERQASLLRQLGLPTRIPRLPMDSLLHVMGRDKKVEHGRLRFVLPDRLGHVELVGDVPVQLVREVLVELAEAP
jgi:3-dehydroquinate synthase